MNVVLCEYPCQTGVQLSPSPPAFAKASAGTAIYRKDNKLNGTTLKEAKDAPRSSKGAKWGHTNPYQSNF